MPLEVLATFSAMITICWNAFHWSKRSQASTQYRMISCHDCMLLGDFNTIHHFHEELLCLHLFHGIVTGRWTAEVLTLMSLHNTFCCCYHQQYDWSGWWPPNAVGPQNYQ